MAIEMPFRFRFNSASGRNPTCTVFLSNFIRIRSQEQCRSIVGLKPACFIGIKRNMLQNYIINELVLCRITIQCGCGALNFYNNVPISIFRTDGKFTDFDCTGTRHVENNALAGALFDHPAARSDHINHIGTVDIDRRVVRKLGEIEGFVVAGQSRLHGALSCHGCRGISGNLNQPVDIAVDFLLGLNDFAIRLCGGQVQMIVIDILCDIQVNPDLGFIGDPELCTCINRTDVKRHNSVAGTVQVDIAVTGI